MKREVTSLVVQLAGGAAALDAVARCTLSGAWVSYLQPTRMDGSVRLGVAVSAFSAVSETLVLRQPRHRLQIWAETCSAAVRR